LERRRHLQRLCAVQDWGCRERVGPAPWWATSSSQATPRSVSGMC